MIGQNFSCFGEYNNPVRIIAFNTAEGRSRDVTVDIADELRRLVEYGEISDLAIHYQPALIVEVTKDELENIALESTRTIEIDEFVKHEEIDPRYIIRPYYLTPTARSDTTPMPSSGRQFATWTWSPSAGWC